MRDWAPGDDSQQGGSPSAGLREVVGTCVDTNVSLQIHLLCQTFVAAGVLEGQRIGEFSDPGKRLRVGGFWAEGKSALVSVLNRSSESRATDRYRDQEQNRSRRYSARLLLRRSVAEIVLGERSLPRTFPRGLLFQASA